VRYEAKAIGAGSEGAQTQLQETYSKSMTLAEAELSKDEEDITCEKFFTGCGGGPLAQVRKGCDCAGDKAAKEPQMLILDLGNSGTPPPSPFLPLFSLSSSSSSLS